MRVDKSKYKVLRALVARSPIYVDGKDKLLVDWCKDTVSPKEGESLTHMDWISQFMQVIRSNASKNIYMVSNTLWKCSHDNCERMMNVIAQEWLPNGSGAILLPDGSMVCYYTHRVDDEEDRMIRESNFDTWQKERCKGMAVIMLFDKDGVLVDVTMSANRLWYEGDNSRMTMHDQPNKFGLLGNSVLSLLAFMQYAETEKVVIENGQKKKHYEDIIQNHSGYPIKYYDSRWIREIIMVEGFKVSGHFRMQPYKKNGEWSKKLIYIEEYEKKGYHRRALKDL